MALPIESECEMSSQVNSGWISPEDVKLSVSLSADWDDYYEGNNQWKQDTTSLMKRWYLTKPERPRWSWDELEIMIYLISVENVGFKKAWKCILQYALVQRSESASSGMWYKLKKQKQQSQEDRSNEDLILLAKQTAKKHWKRMKELPVP